MEDDIARNSAPQRDIARHPLTIIQACELFAELGTPRAKRSVQRFCENQSIDCVRVKGARGDQFFVNRQSVERYAEELKQIEAVASIGAEPIDDAPERAVARNSAPQHDKPLEPTQMRSSDEAAPADSIAIKRLQDENLNLRIDNRGKEQAINFLTTQVSTKDQLVQDLSYRLGAAETRVAQLEAPIADRDIERQGAPESATTSTDAVVVSEIPPENTAPSAAVALPASEPAPKRSLLDRLFG